MCTKKCGICGKDMPATSEFFASRKLKTKIVLQSNCRKCQKEYRREHYENNKSKYIKKAKAYNKSVEKWFEEIKKTNAQSAVVHLDSLFENQHDRKYFLDLLLESENSPTHIVYTAKLDTMMNSKDNFIDFLKEMKGYQEKLSVQVMGIENIGEQGQNFDERCIEIVKSLRENFNKEELSIQIDGAMIPDHVRAVVDAGADAVIVGSYLVKDLEESVFLNHFNGLSEI